MRVLITERVFKDRGRAHKPRNASDFLEARKKSEETDSALELPEGK
jgi:hypothetical protein